MSTEPYSGGKFEIQFNNQQHVRELDDTGSLVIIRSHTLHRVTLVTKGTRKSLTIFLSGPKWR
jgi:predicted 2-oxoglutarate/Fe(II)-dependent dioxygenase YbiX